MTNITQTASTQTNQLQIMSGSSALTMTTREIAELTGKQHKHVLEDTLKMLEELGLTSADFSVNLPDAYGRPQPAFALPKRESIILVSGYNIQMRAKIVDRWQELEAQTQRITYEQIIGVVGESQRSEPPHVQARNQHINEIEQIMETIQQTCIMKINDYVHKHDVHRLTGTQWEQFRKYLQSHGYRVDDGYGNYSPPYNNKWCVILDDDGDLCWVEEPANQTQELYRNA